MSDEIRVSRPQQSYQPQAGMRPEPSMMQDQMPMQKSSKAPWIILAVVVVVLVVLGVVFRGQLFKRSGQSQTAAKSGYQAIFLSNGQVYFGKLTESDANYVKLIDIYYLQVIQPPLQGNNQPGQTGQTAQQPQISLVKLGNELHGPVDEMHISRAQILFYEDLKTDGQVVKAISQYKANPAGSPAPVGK